MNGRNRNPATAPNANRNSRSSLAPRKEPHFKYGWEVEICESPSCFRGVLYTKMRGSRPFVILSGFPCKGLCGGLRRVAIGNWSTNGSLLCAYREGNVQDLLGTYLGKVGW